MLYVLNLACTSSIFVGRWIRKGAVEFLSVVNVLPHFNKGIAVQFSFRRAHTLQIESGGKVEYLLRGHVLDGNLNLRAGDLSCSNGLQHGAIGNELNRGLSIGPNVDGGIANYLPVDGAQSEGILVELDGEVGHGGFGIQIPFARFH